VKLQLRSCFHRLSCWLWLIEIFKLEPCCKQCAYIFIKNFGRGIAFDIVLYTASARKEIDRLRSLPPGEMLPVSPEIARLISNQGIEAFCTCQLAR